LSGEIYNTPQMYACLRASQSFFQLHLPQIACIAVALQPSRFLRTSTSNLDRSPVLHSDDPIPYSHSLRPRQSCCYRFPTLSKDAIESYPDCALSMLLDSIEHLQCSLVRSLVARPIGLLEILINPTRDSAEDFPALGVIGVSKDDVVPRGFDVKRVGSCRLLLGCLSSKLSRDTTGSSSRSIDDIIERSDGVCSD